MSVTRCRREGAARPHRRGDDGVQAGAPGGRRRRREGDRAAARARPGQGGQARRARRPPRATIGHYVHFNGRVGRARRGRLRDRLRRQQRGVPRTSPARSRSTSPRPPRAGSPRRTCPDDERERERAIFEQQADESKPPEVRQKIAEGRLRKWLEEVVLLNQQHVNADKHEGRTIEQLRAEPLGRDRRERRDPALRPLRGRRVAGRLFFWRVRGSRQRRTVLRRREARLPARAAEAVRRGTAGRPRLRRRARAPARDRAHRQAGAASGAWRSRSWSAAATSTAGSRAPRTGWTAPAPTTWACSPPS